MAYAQLTRREGLRDLVVCLNSQHARLYHCGLRKRVARSTLADANERRDAVLFEELGQRLIEMALTQYQSRDVGLGLREPLYAMDSTTIDLCLRLFPWADFRSTKAGIKAHTVIDLRGSIPVMLTITNAKHSDVKQLDALMLAARSIVVLDRGYLDFGRLYALVQRQCSFVIRAKSKLAYGCESANAPQTPSGIMADQIIFLSGTKSKKAYPERLRRVRYYDAQTHTELVLLSNRLDLPALTIAAIYKKRWQIELFFKWLKQNLNVQHFFGNSLNAVRTQIWIAICTYLLTLMAHKPFHDQISLRNFMHVAEANMLEKMTLTEMVNAAVGMDDSEICPTQQELF